MARPTSHAAAPYWGTQQRRELRGRQPANHRSRDRRGGSPRCSASRARSYYEISHNLSGGNGSSFPTARRSVGFVHAGPTTSLTPGHRSRRHGLGSHGPPGASFQARVSRRGRSLSRVKEQQVRLSVNHGRGAKWSGGAARVARPSRVEQVRSIVEMREVESEWSLRSRDQGHRRQTPATRHSTSAAV